ncbi:hypothetical protein P5V15_012409 [Pogonomyrmex californicus]
MAEKDSWAWEHFKKEGNKIRCKICNVGYTLFTFGITNMHKAHLYAHGVSNKEADEEWEKEPVESDPIWEHFTKGKPYTAICLYCKRVLHHAYLEKILCIHYGFHEQQMRIENEVLYSWLYNYFSFPVMDRRIYCIPCKKYVSICYDLETHLSILHNILKPESDESSKNIESTKNDKDVTNQEETEKNSASTNFEPPETYI